MFLRVTREGTLVFLWNKTYTSVTEVTLNEVYAFNFDTNWEPTQGKKKNRKASKDKYISRWLGALGSVTPPWQYTVLFHKP